MAPYGWRNREEDRVIRALLTNPYWEPVTRLKKECAKDFQVTKSYKDAKLAFDAKRSEAPSQDPKTPCGPAAARTPPATVIPATRPAAASPNVPAADASEEASTLQFSEESEPDAPGLDDDWPDDTAQRSRIVTIELDDILHTGREVEVAQTLFAMINSKLESHGIQLEPINMIPVKDLVDLEAPIAPSEAAAIQKVRTSTLAAYSTLLASLEADSGTNGLASHLAFILKRVKAEYEASDSKFPLPLMHLNDQPVPLFWDAIYQLARSGAWIDGNIIDWILMTSDADQDVDYIPTHCRLYAQTINIGTSSETPETVNKAVLDKIATLIGEGPQQRYRPVMKPQARTVIFPWNPTNTHWVLVVAVVAEDGTFQVSILDSSSPRHGPTWLHTPVLKPFIELLGLYHQPFHGQWPTDVQQMRTVSQAAHDCGVLVCWAARLLLRKQSIPEVDDTGMLGNNLRCTYVVEIRYALEGVNGPSNANNHQGETNRSALDIQNAASGHPSPGDNRAPVTSKEEKRKVGKKRKRKDPTAECQDPASDVWLDSQDLLIQTSANAASNSNIMIAILGGYPDGLSPHTLRDLANTRAMALHALSPKIHTLMSISKSANTRRFVQELHPDHKTTSGIAWSAKANPISLNTASNYNVPDVVRELWGTDTHVYSDADDVLRSYDVVLPAFRRSGTHTSGVTFQDIRAEAVGYTRALYNIWQAIFNQHTMQHQEVQDAGELSAIDGDLVPAWAPFLLGLESSNATIFDVRAGHSDTRQDTIEFIKAAQELKTGSPLQVLFVFAGLDTLTTDNRTWAELVEDFPGVEFSMTCFMPQIFSTYYPSVFKTRFGYAWAHLDVQELAREHAAQDPRDVPLLFSKPKVARWLYWMQEMYNHKQNVQNEAMRGFTRRAKKSELMPRLTVHRSALIEQLELRDPPVKVCETIRCSERSPDHWNRGFSSPEALLCNRCSEVAMPEASDSESLEEK